MQTIYVYVLDTFADWELGYVTAELNTGRFFKKRSQADTAAVCELFQGAGHVNGRLDRSARLHGGRDCAR